MRCFYCKEPENIENYQKALADNFNGWQVHHRLETHNSDGERRLVDITMEELIALGMYWHRPADELIFLTESEHKSLHQKGNKNMLGKHHSEETRKKIGEAEKGEKNPMYGKHHSEETRRKMREAKKGMRWFNNGKISKRAFECPDGFIPGRLLIK